MTKVHGQTTWCKRTIYVWQDKDGWYAEIQGPDNDYAGRLACIVRVGPTKSQGAAERGLCSWLNDIKDMEA